MMNALIGGSLIGIAVSIMLLFVGRVTGISGIIGGLLNFETTDKKWRIFFLLGMLFGGVFLRNYDQDQFFKIETKALNIDFVIAGFLVGFGTLLGNGCTSGHGVCGISRLSLRSIFATVLFISSGILSLVIFKYLRGDL